MNSRVKIQVIATLFILFGILLVGCGTYTTTPKSFIRQLEENQNVQEVMHWTPIGFTKYPSNQMDSVLCTNSKGELVYLFPDQNTSIKITSKSSDKEFKAYFDTVIHKNGKLYGLRSRILGGLREIDVDDIDKIEFRAEMPKTKKVEDTAIGPVGAGD